MFNGAPVTRNFLIGFGVSSALAIQLGAKFKSTLGLIGSFLVANPNEGIYSAIVIYYMQNLERIIGSDKLFSRLFYTTLSSRYVSLTSYTFVILALPSDAFYEIFCELLLLFL